MATTPSKPIKTVTINYTDPAPGGTHQLQILNDVAGNVGELQFKGKSGRFDATNNLAWDSNSQTLNIRGSMRLTGNILGNIQGNPSYLKIIGGNVGDVLSTDGAGNLSWQSVTDLEYGNAEVANYMPTYLPTYSGNIALHTIFSRPNANINIFSDNSTFIAVKNSNTGNTGIYGFLANTMVLPGDVYFNNPAGTAADITTSDAKDIDLYTNSFLGNSVEVWLRHNNRVEITTDNGNHVWSFDKIGKLTLPAGGDIVDSTGNSVLDHGTGNWGFRNDTMYNLSGGEINNGDTTHGATSGLILPENGNTTVRTALYNTYGNVQIQVANLGVSPTTSIWNFGTDGKLQLPAGGDIVDSTGNSVLGPDDRLVNGNKSLVLGSDGNVDIAGHLTIANEGLYLSSIGKTTTLGSTILNTKLFVDYNEVGITTTLDVENMPNETATATIKVSGATATLLSTDDDAGDPVTQYRGQLDVSYSGITLTLANPTTVTNWVFDDNNLKLPAGGDIVDINGISVLGGATDNISSGSYNVTVGSDGVISMATARGGIEFGAMPEIGGPQHLHIMRPAGQNSSTDLFFGDDYNYVKLPGSYGIDPNYQQGVEIGSSLNEGAVSTWRFGTDGILTLPSGNTTIGNLFGSDAIISAPNTGFGMLSQGSTGFGGLQWLDTVVEPLNVAGIVVNSPYAASTGSVQIYTGIVGIPPQNAWTFDPDGKLTLPDTGKIATGVDIPQVGSKMVIATDSNEGTGAGTPGVVDVAYDNTIIPTYYYPGGGSPNFTDSTITFANGDVRTITSIISTGGYIEITYSGATTSSSPEFPITLKTGNYVAATTAPEWTFGTDGNLTLPVGGDIKNSSGSSVLGNPFNQSLNTTNSVIFANITGSGNMDIDGEASIGGNLTIVGNITFSGGGSITQITSAYGNFFGNADGSNALYAGYPGGVSVPGGIATFTGDSNAYMQINAQNQNHGTQVSMEYVVTGDLGTDISDYIDMGFTGSAWDGTQENSLGDAAGARDGYLYVQGGGGGGNLIIGTTTAGRNIKFVAGGPNAANVVANISSDGIDTKAIYTDNYYYANGAPLAVPSGNTSVTTTGNVTAGNVIAGNFSGNGSQLTSIAGANVTGYVANAVRANTASVANSVSVANVSGIGNIAIINKDGNASNVLYGNGVFASAPVTYGNSNVAAYLPNYTGTLTSVDTITANGNITTSGKFVGDGSSLTNVTVNVAGNIQGTSANVSLVAGSYTMTFDNTGKLSLPTIGGDEGGEINFGIPASNTTLTTRVVTDVFQNRFRIYDGSTKGVYIDLSQAGTGVSTLLNNRVSGFVNAGTFVTMDNIKATVTTTGNRGLSLATTTGTFTYNIGGTYAVSGSGSGGQSFANQTLTTTATTSIFGWAFAASGDISTYILTDTTNSRCYRITLMMGASFNNNAITIERLI